jgi:hypothetical protein
MFLPKYIIRIEMNTQHSSTSYRLLTHRDIILDAECVCVCVCWFGIENYGDVMQMLCFLRIISKQKRFQTFFSRFLFSCLARA